MRAAIGEFVRYKAAVYSFRDKYLYFPGDIPNAVKFWGAQAGVTTDGVDTTCANWGGAATGTETCNGDGDGFIAGVAADNNRDQFYEAYRFWQHLANAGMIEGKYYGNAGTGSRVSFNIMPGSNVPYSKSGSNAVWHARAVEYEYSDGWFNWPNFSGNIMTLGNMTGPNANNGVGVVFSPEEAWNIDTKLDDSKPATGFINTFMGSGTINPGCNTGAAQAATYALTSTGKLCSMILKLN